jgi:hypothetical protein
MTDTKLKLFSALASAELAARGEPLTDWEGEEPPYKYIFGVRITDTNTQNLKSKVYRIRAPAIQQADVDAELLEMVLDEGKKIHEGKLNLLLRSSQPSLVIFYLNEDGVTFQHEDYEEDNVRQVIHRKPPETPLIFRAMWLKGATDRKAISVILAAGHPETDPMSYGLRVRVVAGTDDSFSYIDPKIDNDGEG